MTASLERIERYRKKASKRRKKTSDITIQIKHDIVAEKDL